MTDIASEVSNNVSENTKLDIKELMKKDATRGKRVLKLLKRKKARQSLKEGSNKSNQNNSTIDKEEIAKLIPLESKQKHFLIPLGKNTKLKKIIKRAGRDDDKVNNHHSSTAAGEGSSTESEDDDDSDNDDLENFQDQEFNNQYNTDIYLNDVSIEYVPVDESAGATGQVAELAHSFSQVFAYFRNGGLNENENENEEDDVEIEEDDVDVHHMMDKKEERMGYEDDDENDGDDDEGGEGKAKTGKKVSIKAKRLASRPHVCDLKALAKRPDMVEVWDTTSADPHFLVYLKSLRNVVPVPPHWSQKRKYLQWKRGFEKPPFKLPPHIEATKISEIRSALVELEANKTMRQKMREKVRPKTNRLSIDYQTLHDCFFKYAVKPPLTKFGDLYYEGKEFEKKSRYFKPGKLSERLQKALGMGPVSPPPWLINMQRYGPPPAYSRLPIPGLNAPIPTGASYGYQPGGWGKPPVDEFGNLLYQLPADVNLEADDSENIPEAELWGELPKEEEVEVEPEEGDEAPTGEAAPQATSSDTPLPEGLSSVGGSTSLGLESPASFDIRQMRGTSSISSSVQKPYQVLTPQESHVQSGQLFGVQHTYKMPSKDSGILTPGGTGSVTPRLTSGSSTPYAQGNILRPGLASGASTPLNQNTIGFATPDMSVALNPPEMEQEGTMTTEAIREQLKQHEEAASRAKAAAGQVDPTDQKKRKGDEIRGVFSGTKTQKKKKQFKF